MENMLKGLEKENVMFMCYTYGKVEGAIGEIDAPKSSRMFFKMKDMENVELLTLFVQTALQVSKKEQSQLCYTIAKSTQDTLIQVLQENGFACKNTGTEEEILFTKEIAFTQEESDKQPKPFDGIDCFILWGTQGVSYKIGKGTNMVVRTFDSGEFLTIS